MLDLRFNVWFSDYILRSRRKGSCVIESCWHGEGSSMGERSEYRSILVFLSLTINWMFRELWLQRNLWCIQMSEEMWSTCPNIVRRSVNLIFQVFVYVQLSFIFTWGSLRNQLKCVRAFWLQVSRAALLATTWWEFTCHSWRTWRRPFHNLVFNSEGSSYMWPCVRGRSSTGRYMGTKFGLCI